MRNIKRYATEDLFAQAENNSGYPSGSVTTIFPGMAYVVEDKNIYFNEDPLPPLPEFKHYWCFSGRSFESYDYVKDRSDDGSWVLNGSADTTFIFPVNSGPADGMFFIQAGIKNVV